MNNQDNNQVFLTEADLSVITICIDYINNKNNNLLQFNSSFVLAIAKQANLNSTQVRTSIKNMRGVGVLQVTNDPDPNSTTATDFKLDRRKSNHLRKAFEKLQELKKMFYEKLQAIFKEITQLSLSPSVLDTQFNVENLDSATYSLHLDVVALERCVYKLKKLNEISLKLFNIMGFISIPTLNKQITDIGKELKAY